MQVILATRTDGRLDEVAEQADRKLPYLNR